MSAQPVDKKILKTLVPLNSLGADPFAELAGKATCEVITAGRYAFKAGDEDHRHVYIIDGEIELLNAAGDPLKSITGGTPDAIHPLAPLQPRQLGARAKTDVTIISVDSNQLDFLLSWDQQSGNHDYGVGQIDADHADEEDGDWMTNLLATKAFHNIPPANLQNLFMALEEVEFKSGDTVIKQGDPGDYFYIISSGQCQALLESEQKPEGIPLSTMGVGTTFGEEALISDSARSATVKMLTDGTLMRLSKEMFTDLLKAPLMKTVEFNEVKDKVAAGAKLLDVRLPAEFKKWNIKSSINMPLQLLRKKVDTLDKSITYIVVCDTGNRSLSAGYLLNERGFDSYVLKNGMQKIMPQT